MTRGHVRFGLLVVAVALGAVGCSDPASRSISIVSPGDGITVTCEDDVSTSIAGTQIDVTVRVGGFASGDVVHLTVNNDPTLAMDRTYSGDDVVFNDVTLETGENVLEASGGGVRIDITVTLDCGHCPVLTFARPAASARLETLDDADDDPSNGFQYDVQITTTAADGADVELLVAGASVGTATATAGRVDFAAVTLAAAYPEPGAAVNVTLRAQTSPACTATITVQIVRSEVCPSFTFVEPPPAGATYGVSDDENLDMADGFQKTIVVSTDAEAGTDVQLLVDGGEVASTTVSGTVLQFVEVDLSDGEHVLRVQTSDVCPPPGDEVTITVETGSPECDIVAPPGGSLNAGDDVDAGVAGLQIDFDVTSDAEDGQPVVLIIDGVETGAPSENLAGGHAVFDAIDLDEGPREVQARCRNAVGNIGFSTTFTYTVDTVIPGCAITAPADGTWFNDGDDALAGVAGTQVQLTVSTTDSPTGTTVAQCGAAPLDPEGIVALDGSGAGTGHVTLTGVGNEVCCAVQDDAGNAGEGRITLNLETDAPQFAIRRPDAATALILAVNDEGPSDTLCQYTVEVGCSNVGQEVTLYVNDVPKTPVTCVSSGDALGGTATWTSTTLPQGSVTLRAEGDGIGGLHGVSPDKAVTVDTEPPVLALQRPTCGAILTPADDVDGNNANGIQVLATVRTSDPMQVTLEVTDATTGAAVPPSPYTATPGGGFAQFPTTTLVPPGLTYGSVNLAAYAVDDHGQRGDMTPSPCSIEVRDVPQVNITAPADGALLGPANDCDVGAAGFQLGVTVQTNITSGTVELFVGGASAGSLAYSGSPVTFCVGAADGAGIAIRADGTDARGTGTDSITVTIDSTPPDVAITDLAIAVADRRRGTLDLAWTAPSDAGGGSVSGYQIRCLTAASAAATFDWATATPYSFTGSVVAPGAPQLQRLTGFRIERYVTCMVRATDGGGSLGPVGNAPQVQLAFLRQEILGPTATTLRFGSEIEPLGDINGDTYPDFGIGTAAGASAYLVFGQASGAPSAWGTAISGPPASGFGASLAGVGDFDGDTRNDVLIGAWGGSGPAGETNRGRAFLFKGRASWPATLDVSAADVTFLLDDSTSTQDNNGFLGWAVASAGDFDGDTRADLLIGIPGWNGFQGATLLYFGRSSPPASVTVPGDRATGFGGDIMFGTVATGGQFGTALAGGQLVNADSFSDVLIGEPSTANGGSAYLSFGRSRSITTGLVSVSTYDQQLVSPTAGASINFGAQLAMTNLDGGARADLLVYMDYPPGGTANDQGVVLTFLNASGSVPSSYTGSIRNDASPNTSDRLGLLLATGQAPGLPTSSDMDGDGRTDVLVGMNRLGGAGGAGRLFMGRDFATAITSSSADVTVAPDTTDVLSNGGVGYLADVTGDGSPDFAVGHTRHSTDRGRIIVVY
ncbi:MAG: FG-GAP repeat protein [Deltaproteobacteria bacterium]|nr:FG-GAP repeat protein [Deltaproteobacteria bacterium]